MENLSNTVLSYIESLGAHTPLSGYLRVNQQRIIITGYGEVSHYDLNSLDTLKPAEQCLPFIEGLIPFSENTIDIIENVHIENAHYFDIHLISDGEEFCFLFFENTQSALQLQEEQQVRLDIDFQNDKRKRG